MPTISCRSRSRRSPVSLRCSGGEQKRAVRVQADPAKLAAMGLTLEDIRGTLINSTADAPKGTVDAEDRSYAVFANDQLTKGTEYDNVILSYRNGAPVRVKDIGRAVDGPENRLLAGWQNGQRGINLSS
jgi:multidrug efflux pump subunit AcrB